MTCHLCIWDFSLEKKEKSAEIDRPYVMQWSRELIYNQMARFEQYYSVNVTQTVSLMIYMMQNQ